MRSKAPLALMEQVIMILVFALAAVLCLRIFLWSDQQSRRNEACDQAVILAQSAAETLKCCSGDYKQAAATRGGFWDGTSWTLSDKDYQVTVIPEDSGHQYLGQALVSVTDRNGAELFCLQVCWQEGASTGQKEGSHE